MLEQSPVAIGVHDVEHQRSGAAADDRCGVDPVQPGGVDDAVSLVAVADDAQQGDPGAELREADGPVGALATQQLEPRPDRRTAAGVGHLLDGEDQVAGDLADDQDTVVGPRHGGGVVVGVGLHVSGLARPRRTRGGVTLHWWGSYGLTAIKTRRLVKLMV